MVCEKNAKNGIEFRKRAEFVAQRSHRFLNRTARRYRAEVQAEVERRIAAGEIVSAADYISK